MNVQSAVLETSESALIIELRNKTNAGYERLYKNYASSLFGVIQKIIPDKEMAEDILMEVFQKAMQSFETYSPEKGRLFTWLLNIARHKSIDTLRSKDFKKAERSQSLDDKIDENRYSRTTHLTPDHMDVKQLLNSLNPQQKTLIDLMYFKGYTQAEISEEFDIPLGTVKTRVRAAITHLRKVFNYKNSD